MLENTAILNFDFKKKEMFLSVESTGLTMILTYSIIRKCHYINEPLEVM